MSGEKPEVSTYREFADNVLPCPCIRANNYNIIQLMALAIIFWVSCDELNLLKLGNIRNLFTHVIVLII
jgi:hypothetical protein